MLGESFMLLSVLPNFPKENILNHKLQKEISFRKQKDIKKEDSLVFHTRIECFLKEYSKGYLLYSRFCEFM